jgi:hypothetical protein
MMSGKNVKNIPEGPVDWTIIERERKISEKQCLDGDPGLSDQDFDQLLKSDKEARTLYGQYKAKYSTENKYHRNLIWFYYSAAKNMGKALREIIKTWEGEIYLLHGVNTSRGTFPNADMQEPIAYLGQYNFEATNELNFQNQEKLIEHIINGFNQKGVLFKKEDIKLRISPVVGSTHYNYCISFPMKECSGKPNV